MTRNRTNLYGWKLATIASAVEALSRRLGLSFVARSSDYVEEKYWRTPIDSPYVIQVMYNFMDEERLYEEDFPEYKILIEIADAPDWDILEVRLSRLEGLDLLRSDWEHGTYRQ